MFVGHGLLAFAGAAGVAALLGQRRERALALGICAGAFALAPDVDIVYAPVGVVHAALDGGNVIAGFWGHGNLVHRAVTHSLIVGVVTSLAVGCWAVFERTRVLVGTAAAETSSTERGVAALAASVALTLLGGSVVVAGIESGSLGAVVLSLFAATTLAVATAGARWGLSARELGAVALFGLCSHPFGDLFTGTPPAFLYPLDLPLVTERISLYPDPTLHLLGTFAIELATFWAAAVVYASLSDRRLRACIDWRAALGVGYAGTALALPAPTLDSSYRFVVSVLAFGLVLGVTPVPARSDRSASFGAGRPEHQSSGRIRSIVGMPVRAVGTCHRTVLADPFGAALTGLTTITTALVAYTVTYVSVVGP